MLSLNILIFFVRCLIQMKKKQNVSTLTDNTPLIKKNPNLHNFYHIIFRFMCRRKKEFPWSVWAVDGWIEWDFFIICKFCLLRLVRETSEKKQSQAMRQQMRWDTIWWPINIYLLVSGKFFLKLFKVIRTFPVNNFVIQIINLYGSRSTKNCLLAMHAVMLS